MSDEEFTLDPSVVQAIRNVPAADPALKEQHIAAAVAAIAASSASTRTRVIGRWAGAVAAAVALVAVGFVVGGAGSNTSSGALEQNSPSESAPDTVAVVKGGAPGQDGEPSAMATTTVVPDSTCDETIQLQAVVRYNSGSGWRVAYLRTDPARTLVIVDEGTCTVLEEIDLP